MFVVVNVVSAPAALLVVVAVGLVVVVNGAGGPAALLVVAVVDAVVVEVVVVGFQKRCNNCRT